jgi:hypothetical protein
MKNKTNLPLMEQSLLKCLQALDNQIAREMQRTPAQVDEHGVQKWQPYTKRIEQTCSFGLNSFGEGLAQLDGVLVLSQALTKTLRLVIEDLGPEGLGKTRTGYCQAALGELEREIRLASRVLSQDRQCLS